MSATKEKGQVRGFAPSSKNQASRNRAHDTRKPEHSLDSIHFLQRHLGNDYLQATAEERRAVGSRSFCNAATREGAGRTIQAKLTVNQPGDKYEQEAERVADLMIRTPELPVQRRPELEDEAADEAVQTTPVSVQITSLGKRQVEPKKEDAIQTKKDRIWTSTFTPELETRINAIQGRGHPLPDSLRAFFEPRFGQDFSRVRVHSNQGGAEMARALDAKAFTTGWNIVFGSGQYSPGTPTGHKLLAHELTHIVQQSKHAESSQHSGSFLQREVSADIEQIRSDLSYGSLDWEVTESDVRNVIEMLKKLNDDDLEETLVELEKDELIDRIFENISDDDLRKDSVLLDRIRQLRPGKTLLVHIPTRETIICKEPPKGPWEMTTPFVDLSDLIKTVKEMSQRVPPPTGPVYFAKLGILSHGDNFGQIILGSTLITWENVDDFGSELSTLASYLTADADVYFFGCLSGGGHQGTTLLQKLSLHLSGRRVIGFNRMVRLPKAGKAYITGEMCVWPDLSTTEILPEADYQKLRFPATDTSPHAKIARSGKIVKFPHDEIPELSWQKVL